MDASHLARGVLFCAAASLAGTAAFLAGSPGPLYVPPGAGGLSLVGLAGFVSAVLAGVFLWRGFSGVGSRVSAVGRAGAVLLPVPFLSVVGYVLVGIALYLVGSRLGVGRVKAGGVVVAVPFLSFAGFLIAYVGLRGAGPVGGSETVGGLAREELLGAPTWGWTAAMEGGRVAYLVLPWGGVLEVRGSGVFGRGNLVGLPPEAAQRISQRHFRIFYMDGVWWIEDLGSAGGTVVDGRDIKGLGPVPLADGSVISPAGVVELRFAYSR